MSGIRLGQRRAVRDLGWSLRARASPVEKASGLIPQYPRVTAVVVAHNGAEYLPETLAALGGQRRPADLHVGIDAGSTDESASILQLRLPAGSPVVGSSARAGFGAAVDAGLAALAEQQENGDHSGGQDWIWLLHDDSAPEPDALEELLLAVERAPSVTVAGAKQVEWSSPRKLIDVGLSISRWGQRLTLIDVDELDQGQYDSRSDVFAVNSAGMLIRRDIWDLLGGFDPALPGTGDDVDFCWRNRLAGHRVIVVPGAVVRHAASRDNSAATFQASRKAEIHLRLKHATLWKVPFLAIGAVIGGFGRLAMGLLAKDPGYGFGQLFASFVAVLRPADLFRSRRSAALSRKLPRTVVRALRIPGQEVWSHRKSVLDAFTSRNPAGNGTGVVGAGAEAHSEYIPSGDSRNDFAALLTPSRTRVGLGAVSAFILLTIVSLAGMHRFLGAPALTGGALLPVSEDIAAIWRNASTWWISLGSGVAGHGDPFDYVLWLLAALGFGNGNPVLVGLILLSLPLAGLSAWFAAGALTRRRGLRFWAALAWAAVPAAQVALGSGRLGALLAHILLPLVALGMMRAVGSAVGRRAVVLAGHHDSDDRTRAVVLKPGVNGIPSWTAAASAGLLLAVVVAGAPSLFPLAMAAVLGITLLMRRRARTLWWSLLPPLVLFVPFAASTIERPRGILGDPGVPVPFAGAELWQQLLGYPVAFDPFAALGALPSLPSGPWALPAAIVVGAPVLLLSAAALFIRGQRRGTVRVLWTLGLLALLSNAAFGFLATSVSSSTLIPPFTGPLVSVFTFTMLAAALIGGDNLLRRYRDRRRHRHRNRDTGTHRGMRSALVGGAVVLALGPVTSLALWVIPQINDAGTQAEGTYFGTELGISPSAVRTLPATATDRGNSGDRTRTLVLTVDSSDHVSAALMRGGGTTLDQLSQIYSARAIFGPLGSAALREDDDAAALVRSTAAVIVAGTGVDPRNELEMLGVGFVVLQQSDTAADVLAGQIDSVPGLVSVGNTDAGWLWRVVPPALVGSTGDTGDPDNTATPGARVRIVNADGNTETVVESGPTSVSTVIPAGSEGRSLVVAERSHPGWQATLDGRPLESTSTGWNQEFALPADGGRLELGFVSPWEPWAGIGQAVVIGLTVLLAVPIPSRPRFIAVPPDRVRTTQRVQHATGGPAVARPTPTQHTTAATAVARPTPTQHTTTATAVARPTPPVMQASVRNPISGKGPTHE